MDRDKIRKMFVDTAGGKELRDELLHRQRVSYNALKTATEPIQIGRHQGNLEVYDWLLSIRED